MCRVSLPARSAVQTARLDMPGTDRRMVVASVSYIETVRDPRLDISELWPMPGRLPSRRIGY
jgi:hypothetical protein